MASPPKALYSKLKPGPGKSSQAVRANQRTRLHGATIELASQVGYERLTVRGLSRLAGVSTATFYQHFANVEECFAATYESIARRALRRAHAAREESRGWEMGIRSVLHSLLEDAARYPKEARLVTIEAFAAGTHTRSRMRSGMSILEHLLGGSSPGLSPPTLARKRVSRGIAGALTRVTWARLEAVRSAELPAVAAELEEWAVSLFGEGLAQVDSPRNLHDRPRHDGDAAQGIHETILGAAGDERGRILTAVTKLSLSGGFADLTVTKIRTQAGASRRGFGACFTDVEDCFLEAIEAIAVSAVARARATAHNAGTWEATLYREVQALCVEAAQHPDLAQLSLVDVLTPGRAGLERRERLVSLAAARLRAAAPPGRRPSPLQAEAAIAAALAIANVEVETARAGELPRLAPLLAYVSLAAAIGATAAAKAVTSFPLAAA